MKRFLLTMAGVGLTTSLVFAQTQTVRGVIVDAGTGEPVIGANVIVKGHSGVGASTNIDGKFTLNAPKGATHLIVSYIGYKKTEVAIRPNLTIKLESDTEALDEVMVVAFGTAKKSSFTGSATVVNSKALEKMQVSNVTKALEGKVAGVFVSSGDNQPGMTASLSIRGIGSFTAKSDPLYVVDGVPFSGDISSINPADIESTSILKDASSAALYGARGANGVIMITTKKGLGDTGKVSVNFEARYGFNSRAIKDYDYIKDPKVYAAKVFESMYYDELIDKQKSHEEALKNAYALYFSTDKNKANLTYPLFEGVPQNEWFQLDERGHFVANPALKVGTTYTDPKGGKYYMINDDWAEEVFSTNPRQEYNLSLSGRGSKSNYFLSASYLNDKGYIVASGFERLTTRLKGDYDVAKWLRVGANMSYSYYESNTHAGTSGMGDSGNIFAIAGRIAPVFPLYVRDEKGNIKVDSYGNQLYDFGTGGSDEYYELKRPFLAISNPLALYKLDERFHKANIFSLRGYAEIKPIDGLALTLNVGYDNDDTHHLAKRNALYGQFASQSGVLYREANRTSSINLQQLATYRKNFGEHHFDFLLGHEFYKNRYNMLSGEKEGIYRVDETELNGAIRKPSTSSYHTYYATEGYLGRVQYDFANKYFFQASYRRDASSRFHKDVRWGNFWSVGASWLLHRESFMKSLKFINNLKFKISYGQQGNDNIDDFLYLDRYDLKNANDKFSVSFRSKGNDKLTWENSSNLNTGIEFSVLKNRLSGSFEWYQREVTDMLFFHTSSRSGGYSGYYDNIGAMRNRGVELELTGVLLDTKKVNWTLSFNAGYNTNTLTKLPEEWEKHEGGYRDGDRIYRVGGSIYDRTYPKFLGLNDKGQSLWSYYNSKEKKFDKTATYTDADNKESREIFTHLRPKWRGGITSTLEAYGFDLSASLSWALGGFLIDNSYQSLIHGGTSSDMGKNFHRDILNSWTPKNTNTDIPRVSYSGSNINSISDRFLISRSYLSLNNLTLGYTLPKHLISKWGLSSLRVYLVGDNLGLLSARQGFDPRFGGGVGYKAIRTVSFGLKLGL